MRVGEKHWHVSRLSASYSLEFAAVLARVWKNAVHHLKPAVQAEPPQETPLEARLRSRFTPVVPQVSSVSADCSDELEQKGRAMEKLEIMEREQLADTFRGAESAPGRKSFAVTAALRAALIIAQLRDPVLAGLMHRLSNRTESIAGSAGRTVVPAAKAEQPTRLGTEAPRAKVFCPICSEQIPTGDEIKCRHCGHFVVRPLQFRGQGVRAMRPARRRSTGR
jgi:hypothetical protein